MKEGDKIICIKEYYCEGSINLGLLFYKGKEYKIHKIEFPRNKNGVEIIVLNNINNNLSTVCGSGVSFYESIYGRLFSDYFITIKQYRKLKLDKINESREISIL